jgi:hypothetical protein
MNIINQCKAKGGKFVNNACIYPSQKSKFTFNFSLAKFKQIGLWIFISIVIIASTLGVFSLMGSWGETQQKILFTTLLVGFFGILTIANMAIFQRRLNLLVLLESVIFFSMVTGILMVWSLLDSSIAKIWGSIGLFFGFGLIALADLAIMKKYKWLAYTTFGICLFAFIMAMLSLWLQDYEFFVSKDYLKFMFDFAIVSFFGGHLSLMLLIEPKKKSVYVIKWIAMIFAGITALLFIALVHMSFEEIISWWRILGIVGIINVASTIITPVLNRTR